jgi:SOS response regulatory protein OraA/RecX
MEILQRAFEKQNRKYGNNNEKFINSMLRLGFNYTQIKNIIKAKEYTNFNKL